MSLPRTLLLDCEGLHKLIVRDRALMALVAVAVRQGTRVVVSAETLVEARDPRSRNRTAFNHAVSAVVVVPVTKEIAVRASDLLADLGGSHHGHKYAIDAIVAATALELPAPVRILTSDVSDLVAILGDRAKEHGIDVQPI